MERLLSLAEVQADIIDEHEGLREDCEPGTDDYRYHSKQITTHMDEFTRISCEIIRMLEENNITLREQRNFGQVRNNCEAIKYFQEMIRFHYF